MRRPSSLRGGFERCDGGEGRGGEGGKRGERGLVRSDPGERWVGTVVAETWSDPATQD